jgi:hypothetical protein
MRMIWLGGVEQNLTRPPRHLDDIVCAKGGLERRVIFYFTFFLTCVLSFTFLWVVPVYRPAPTLTARSHLDVMRWPQGNFPVREAKYTYDFSELTLEEMTSK